MTFVERLLQNADIKLQMAQLTIKIIFAALQVDGVSVTSVSLIRFPSVFR